MSSDTRAVALAVLLLPGLTACIDRITGPDRVASSARPTSSAVKFWDANATADWHEFATSLQLRRPAGAVFRMYTYLSLAQLRAAEDAQAIRPHQPTSAAISAASAAVLASFFPLDAGEIQDSLDARAAAEPWPGAKHQDFAVGEAIGRAAAARVIDFSRGDRIGLANPGLPPVGPEYWRGGTPARGGYKARPFFFTSEDELRPPPPPAFGSPAFAEALAEVLQIAQTRTPEQIAIALYWTVNQSASNDAAMNRLAVELIRTHRRGEAESARILVLMSAAEFDANIGCFNAKYEHWLVRPAQADPRISVVFNAPSHPSYPAGHSCNSGAAIGVPSAEFPDQASRLGDIAVEAGLSRVYAGIHYRFDVDAGLALGRAAAAKALAADLDRVSVR